MGIAALLPRVRKELAIVGDLDARTSVSLLPLYVRVERYRAHDAVPELFVDQRLYRRAIALRDLVYPIDRRVGGDVLIQGPAQRDLLQGPADLLIESKISTTVSACSGLTGCWPSKAAVVQTLWAPTFWAIASKVSSFSFLGSKINSVASSRIVSLLFSGLRSCDGHELEPFGRLS